MLLKIGPEATSCASGPVKFPKQRVVFPGGSPFALKRPPVLIRHRSRRTGWRIYDRVRPVSLRLLQRNQVVLVVCSFRFLPTLSKRG